MSRTIMNEWELNEGKVVRYAVEAIVGELGLSTTANRIGVKMQGLGGQSVVYSVDMPECGRVCLKLARNRGTMIHLSREGHFLRELHSEHFPRLIIDASRDGFIVEEWIDGQRLGFENRTVLLSNLKIIIRDIQRILSELVFTIPAIMHRDLKPHNLRLRRGKLIALDFGSSEYEGSRNTAVSVLTSNKLGRCTHVFQPLEQLCSDPYQDRRVDVFAAAGIVFAVLEGRPPYDNSQAGFEEARRHYKRIEFGLEQILMKKSGKLGRALFDALRVDPEERSKDFIKILKAVESDLVY